MVESCESCACFPVCDRKFNMFGTFLGWAECNNYVPEMKHGKWIYCGNPIFAYECSVCGEKQDIQTRHCSGCGTRMDGDK